MKTTQRYINVYEAILIVNGVAKSFRVKAHSIMQAKKRLAERLLNCAFTEDDRIALRSFVPVDREEIK